MGEDYAAYRNKLVSRCREYGKSFSGAIDAEHGEGHVFLPARQDLNLFDENLAEFIPAHNRHRWFRSMLSSQALAVSVIGTIVERDGPALLSELRCEDSLPLLPDQHGFQLVGFEYAPTWLERGKRKSQIDAFLESPGWRLAIECKLTEQDIGHCQMSKDGEAQSAYRDLPGFDFCHRVKFNGATYWSYWQQISSNPIPAVCSEECPLHRTYQMARNVICAGLDPKTGEFDGLGTALLLYDQRNPSFQPAGDAFQSCTMLKSTLKNISALRTATWQSLAGLLRFAGTYEDLLDYLDLKYGIKPNLTSD
jgi:hypothetical protein